MLRKIELGHEALSAERSQFREPFRQAMLRHRVVGMSGEPEVGVSSVAADCLEDLNPGYVRIDLEEIATQAGLVDRVAFEVSRLLLEEAMPDADIPHPDDLGWRVSSDRQRTLSELERRIGTVWAERAMREHDSSGERLTQQDAFALLAEVSRMRPLLVWLDQLEALEWMPRSALKPERLLWNLRAATQASDLRVLLTCREPAVAGLTVESSAFFGDGEWLEVQRPNQRDWARTLETLSDGQKTESSFRSWIDECFDRSGGHAPTMMLAVCYLAAETGEVPEPFEALSLFAGMDTGGYAAMMKLARSVHRRGGEVLGAIARGEGPYEGVSADQVQDRYRAVKRLHLAGLITQSRPRTWEVTNPLQAWRLRGWMPGQSSS